MRRFRFDAKYTVRTDGITPKTGYQYTFTVKIYRVNVALGFNSLSPALGCRSEQVARFSSIFELVLAASTGGSSSATTESRTIFLAFFGVRVAVDDLTNVKVWDNVAEDKLPNHGIWHHLVQAF